ncbi:MAG: type II secretion system protein GspM [Woeseiaceae bacterium]|jgi:general secretion pathway protein M|nr:type II secretion system protein GspM [Woeseiaceae bacterium]
MREWLDSLAPRERIMVLVCAVVVVIALLWLLVWSPLDSKHAALRASVEDWETGLARLQRVAELRGTGGTTPGTVVQGGNQTPVVIVDTTLRARGLSGALRRSQPTTSTGIRVEFENVAFNSLVLWLGDLSARYGMDVQAGSLSVPPRAEPGRVNVTLTLERRP